MKKNDDRHWLNLAECASLTASVAGCFAATASHQVVYAAAPLTLALSLNLANRQRFQQQLQQQATNRIADVHQEVRFLHNKVQVLPSTERISDLEATIHKQEQIILDIDSRQQMDALVQAFNNRPEPKEIDRLNQAIAQLRHRLEQIPPPTAPFDPTPLKLEIEKIEQSVANLRQSAATTTNVQQALLGEIESLHTSIQSRLEPLEAIDHKHNAQAITLFQTELQALERNTKSLLTSLQIQVDQNRQLIQDLPPPFDSSSLDQRVATLEQNDSSVETKLECLSMSVMQVQSGTASTEEAIALLRKQVDTVAQQLNTLTQQFNTRPELEKIDRLNKALSQLRHRLEQIPPPTAPFDPAPLLKEIEKLEQCITAVRESAATAVDSARQELIGKIESQYTTIQSRLLLLEVSDHSFLEESIKQLQTDLQTLEHNITTQLRDIPPLDSSSLELRVTELELLKSTVETDLLHLLESVKHLQSGTAPIESTIAQIRNQLSDLVFRFNTRPELQLLEELIEENANIQQALSQLPTKLFDLSPLKTEIETLRTITQELLKTSATKQELDTLTQQLWELFEGLDTSAAELHDRTRNLAQMQQDFKSLQELTSSLDERARQMGNRTHNLEQVQQHLDTLQQLMTKYVQADDFENLRAKLSKEIAQQVDVTLEQQVVGINRLLKEIRPKSEYKLVYDRDESREVLLESLQQAEERLILVCPWLTEYVINAEVIQKFRAILNKNGQIDIGWGHLSDTKLNQPKQMTRQEFLYLVRQKARKLPNEELWNYQALRSLEQLEQEYPKQFRLKLLGTHEKFLVCDRLWTMLGSHNFLTSGDKSEEREVGLWTNDSNIIDQMIKRFEDADNLEEQSGMVYLAS